MLCPFCRTENRDERDTCYNCEKDLSMLRLLVNKAKSHFNAALEFAERDRNDEAISELQNALDLDSRHVNSHIVLGSLYAKAGEIAKSEAAWREAMHIDPRFEKAHEYLVKIDTARRKLPVVRRQRLIIIAMVAVLVSLSYFLLTETRPDVHQMRLQSAWEAYDGQNYDQALEVLAKISSEGLGSPAADHAAVLGDIIQAEQRMYLASAQKHLEFGELERAYREGANLLARRPPKSVRLQVQAIQAEAVASARRSVSAALQTFRAGESTRDGVQRAIALCRALQGDRPADDFLADAEREMTEVDRAFRVEEVLQDLDRQDAGLWPRLEAYAALREEFPDYARIQSLIDQAIQTPVAEHLARAEEQIAVGDAEAAQAALQALKRMLDVSDPAKTAALLDPLHEELHKKRTEILIREVRRADAAGRLEQTVALAGQLLEPGAHAIDETTRVAVEDMALRANRRLARRHWDWMVGRDGRYQQGLITAEDAEKTIQRFPQVNQYLSRKVFPSSQDNLLFYLAVAHAKLGHEKEAIEVLERIKKEHPESNIIDWVDRRLEEYRKK